MYSLDNVEVIHEKYSQGGTAIWQGIKTAVNMFQSHGLSEHPRLMIVLTDGKSETIDDKLKTGEEAKEARYKINTN